MQCRSCGAEIDAKAIVCYRCGTPTADPAAARPNPQRAGSGGMAWWWIVLVVLVAGGLFLYWRSLS